MQWFCRASQLSLLAIGRDDLSALRHNLTFLLFLSGLLFAKQCEFLEQNGVFKRPVFWESAKAPKEVPQGGFQGFPAGFRVRGPRWKRPAQVRFPCIQAPHFTNPLLRFGGVGGKGGDVVVEAKEGISLEHVYRANISKRFVAEKGKSASHIFILGPPGQDVVLHVPVGVSLVTEFGKKLGNLLKKRGFRSEVVFS